MRKKLIVSFLALSLTLVSALSFVGCAKDISAEEFTNGVVTSYRNFYNDRENYEEFKDVSLTYNSESVMSYETDWEYTPDGATESIKETYQNKVESKETSTYTVKNIDGELYLTAVSTKEHSEVYYSTFGVQDNAPLEPTQSMEKTIDEWYFGIDNGKYIARRSLTEQEGEQQLGEPINTKTYKIYDSKEIYQIEILNVLSRIDEDIIANAYNSFAEGVNTSISDLEYLFKNAKLEDGKYTASAEIFYPMIDSDSKIASVAKVNVSMQFSENGPEYYNNEMDINAGKEFINTKTIVEFKYDVSLNVIENPLEGYVLGELYAIECVK